MVHFSNFHKVSYNEIIPFNEKDVAIEKVFSLEKKCFVNCLTIYVNNILLQILITQRLVILWKEKICLSLSDQISNDFLL